MAGTHLATLHPHQAWHTDNGVTPACVQQYLSNRYLEQVQEIGVDVKGFMEVGIKPGS